MLVVIEDRRVFIHATDVEPEIDAEGVSPIVITHIAREISLVFIIKVERAAGNAFAELRRLNQARHLPLDSARG